MDDLHRRLCASLPFLLVLCPWLAGLLRLVPVSCAVGPSQTGQQKTGCWQLLVCSSACFRRVHVESEIVSFQCQLPQYLLSSPDSADARKKGKSFLFTLLLMLASLDIFFSNRSCGALRITDTKEGGTLVLIFYY
ncbi:hypothetical protein BDB00DRAFT_802419 [Zychaea mexicana]|uniref:uncharacterized protein n=1 Tax=Zychaea mexicana TaxID=64656 RepID=UPI0022FEA852|nr:uncharacterized protein BDB00DRAFT_802419 [Zychaea mexicana]KAI9497901.1 hypothetical protein BDB00DRAFT_802419 [Zychaea mexicana]